MKNITWINVVLGIWLVIAPFALASVGRPSAWTANDVVLGVLLIGFSWWMVAAAAPRPAAAWFEVLCGIWLIAAPFVLRYGVTSHRSNDVISGVIALIVAAVALTSMSHMPTRTQAHSH
jgi:hypothetical protein